MPIVIFDNSRRIDSREERLRDVGVIRQTTDFDSQSTIRPDRRFGSRLCGPTPATVPRTPGDSTLFASFYDSRDLPINTLNVVPALRSLPSRLITLFRVLMGIAMSNHRDQCSTLTCPVPWSTHCESPLISDVFSHPTGAGAFSSAHTSDHRGTQVMPFPVALRTRLRSSRRRARRGTRRRGGRRLSPGAPSKIAGTPQ